MVTRTTRNTYWTEVKRVVDGEVKVTTCCCSVPGGTRRECGEARQLKNPCRCFCHSMKHDPAVRRGPSSDEIWSKLK